MNQDINFYQGRMMPDFDQVGSQDDVPEPQYLNVNQ